jgi:hypothetical protein
MATDSVINKHGHLNNGRHTLSQYVDDTAYEANERLSEFPAGSWPDNPKEPYHPDCYANAFGAPPWYDGQ